MENSFIYTPVCTHNYLLGNLLNILFGGGITTLPTLPEASSEALEDYYKESENASEEEKRALMKKYFDPDGIIDKYFDKLHDPIEAAKLNSKLMKIDAKIAVLSKKKQEIVDKGVK